MAGSDKIDLSAFAFWSFILSVFLLPIGLGGDRPIPLGIAQAGLALSCALTVLSTAVWERAIFFDRLRWALGLFTLVLIWALLQTQPFMPSAWQHPLWKEAASVLTVPVHGVIAVAPEDSIKGLVRLITYLATGLLAYLLTQESKRADQLLQAFWGSGVVICLYGLLLKAVGSRSILWFDKWAYQDDLTSTFVNHNHFAIYAGMVLSCGVALLARSFIANVRHKMKHERVHALRAWLVQYGVFQSLLLVLVLICIVFSHSRSGLVLALAGVGVYAFLYQLYLRAWKRAAIIAVVCAVGLSIGFFLAVKFMPHFQELFNDYSSRDRWTVYKIGFRALRDNPWLGYGLNGFEPEFRLYQQNMIMEFNHAHNDILESLVDLGIPAGLMLWTAIGLLLSGLFHGVLSRRRNGIYPVLGLVSSFIVLLHGGVDFTLQIPGVVVPWAALFGTGLAQSWGQSDKASAIENRD